MPARLQRAVPQGRVVGAHAEDFAAGGREDTLPRRPDIENVSKRDVDRGLKRATRPSSKGEYHKGRHSFEILATVDPGRVVAASPHAKRLIDTLLDKS